MTASADLPGTWRVVFSSTGDLVPAHGAVVRPPQARMWIEAARRPLRLALDSINALLLPSDCRICSQPLVRLSRIPVCESSLDSLAPSDVRTCLVCGEALESLVTEAEPLCGVFRRVHPRFDFAISFGSYDGALRSLVHLLKYEQLRPAANVLGTKLAQAIGVRVINAERQIMAVPVPLHKTKRRQRGFNQSDLLARIALRYLDRSRFELHTGLLRRVRATVSQTGLTRHQRRENVRGAFVVASPDRVRTRDVMVVDDVYTTGTTLNECARLLRVAGAKQVIVATVARVYRSVTQVILGEMPTQEENAAVFIGAAAG